VQVRTFDTLDKPYRYICIKDRTYCVYEENMTNRCKGDCLNCNCEDCVKGGITKDEIFISEMIDFENQHPGNEAKRYFLPKIRKGNVNKAIQKVDRVKERQRQYEYYHGLRTPQRSYKRKVNKLSSEGKLIKTYGSLKEAAESINGSSTAIMYVCQNKRHTAYGYRWEYAREVDYGNDT